MVNTQCNIQMIQNCTPETSDFINQCHPNKFNRNFFKIEIKILKMTKN